MNRNRQKDQTLEQRVSQLEHMLSLKQEQLDLVNDDTKWTCEKCAILLGVYDPKEDTLRLRYKDHVVHVRCGIGGHVTTVCRKCAHINTIYQVENDDCKTDD